MSIRPLRFIGGREEGSAFKELNLDRRYPPWILIYFLPKLCTVNMNSHGQSKSLHTTPKDDRVI